MASCAFNPVSMKSLLRLAVVCAAFGCMASQVSASTSGYSLGLNFGADEPDTAATGTLLPSDVAGVVPQANWNNLEGAGLTAGGGFADSLKADDQGSSVNTSASVEWDSNNLWASTGRGEENNGFAEGSPDYKLMLGYLDTGDPTTTTVTVFNLPSQLTSGYDLYIYMLGGTGGTRGGGYRVSDQFGTILREFLVGDAPVNPTEHSRDLGFSHDDKGTYLVFRGLTAAGIYIEATTEAPNGLVRAPINAIQLVAAARDTTAPTAPAGLASGLTGSHIVQLNWDASTDNSGAVYYYEVQRDGETIGQTADTTFSDQGVAAGGSYAYRVRALDDSLNASGFSNTLNISTPAETEGEGFLKFEYYTGMESGTDVFLLQNWIDNGNEPNLVSYTPSFDSRPIFPDDSHEQYGAVISGWITPATSGNYTFFLRSDDASQLYLSTTDKEADIQLIAEQTGCCNAFTELDTTDPTLTPYTSQPINLTANQRYYVRLLYKEGGGGDYGQVAWRIAGDSTPAGALAPIPGAFLSAPIDATGASVTITQQPQPTTATEGTTATVSIAATFTSPYASDVSYQWYRNGTAIAGATESSYTTAEVTQSADQGAKFQCVVSVPGAVVTSDEIALTVAADTIPPRITRVTASSVSTLIVSFSEPIDAASAAVVGNYAVSGGVTVSGATASPSSVLLNTSALTVGASYTLTAGGVKDRFNNALPAGSTVNFLANVVTYADVILADEPVMFYRFEETSGQVTKNFGTAGTAADGLWMSGGGPDDSAPVDVNPGTGPRPGEFLGFSSDNRSGLFTGQEGLLWVDAQLQLLNNLGAFSLEYWVKPKNRVSDPTTFGTRIGIVGQNDAIEYGFIDQNTIQIWTPGGGSLNTTYSFPDDTWHHVATIADGTSIKNYFDGVFMNQTSSTTGNYGSSTYNVHVGGGGAFDATGNHFTGEIDEVAIFQKAIPAERIAAHYRAGKEGGVIETEEAEFTSATVSGGNLTLEWTGGGTLQTAPAVTGPWTDVAGATSPYSTPANAAAAFYQVKN